MCARVAAMSVTATESDAATSRIAPAQEQIASSRLPLRVALPLGLLFFVISLGLGYPILNRYSPPDTPGLRDTQQYALLVTNPRPGGSFHMHFRVLVPYVARPFYLLARGRAGSWNPVMFGLLVSDSLFTAAAAALLVSLAFSLTANYPASLGAALLYLLNFAVANLRLAGLVDAAEGLFLLAIVVALFNRRYAWLPLLTVLGAISKESFVPFSIVLMAVWISSSWRQLSSRTSAVIWTLVSWLAALAAMLSVQWFIAGHAESPLQFALSLHDQAQNPLAHLAGTLIDRNLWYVYAWLLPLALFRIKRLPRVWTISTAATSLLALLLVEYHAAADGTFGRATFSIAGPLLCVAAALLLFESPRTAAQR